MKKLFIALTSIVLILSIFMFGGLKVNAKQSTVGKIDCLICNPGEDCSSELRFAWKSSEKNCYFYFTVATDPNFSFAQKIKVSGTYDNTSFTNTNSDDAVLVEVYTYEYNMEGLVPDTQYLYKVTTIDNSTSTKTHSAKTASLSGTFNYLWIGDAHLTCFDWATEKRTNNSFKMIKKATEFCGGADLIVSTGDLVSYGSYYADWLEWNESDAFCNYIFADTTGNHDYYSRTIQAGSSKMTDFPYSWEASRNMPTNGITEFVEKGFKSNYYYLYNSCLFIAVDSISSSSPNRLIEKQKTWMKEVVEKEEGNFQWLIVYEHYPYFDGETAATNHYTSCYDAWYKIFDELGVDLAMSGDSHVYLRSKPLKGNKVDASGTVYMTCPQVGDRYRFITERRNDELMEVRIGTGQDKDISNYGLKDASGMSYIQITPESLTLSLIDTSFTVKDTFTIQPHREMPANLIERQAGQKDLLIDSFELLGYNGNEHETLVFDANRASYLKKVAIKNGENTTEITSFASACIDLGNLEDNKTYELDITATFTDGTTRNFKVYGSTYQRFGEISNFQVGVKDGKTVLTWDADVTDIVAKYEVFVDGASIGSTTSSKLELDTKMNINTVYTLKAYTAKDEVLFSTTSSYKLIGDINYDGIISDLDCDAIYNHVFGEELTGTAAKYADLNNDNRINFADVLMMVLYQSGKIEKTYTETYTVTFKDEIGKDLVTVIVEYGDDALAPTAPAKSGYTFVGWSKPVTNVTTDLIVYAVYNKNE